MEKTDLLKKLSNLTSETDDILLFDTHCHLSDESYNDEEILRIINSSFFKSWKNHVLNVGFDVASNKRLLEQSKNFPFNVHYAVGIHPNSNFDLFDESMILLEKQIVENRISAVGETGLDYYRSYTDAEKQKEFLRRQVLLAKKYNLPVLLHLRDKGDNSAFYDAIEIVEDIKWNKGVVHCFSASREVAGKFVDLGFYISFSGIITFKSYQNFNNVIDSVPLDRILVETDSPYLSPTPFRGRKNYPWNIIRVVEVISTIKKVPVFDLSLRIFLNSLNLLKINF